MEWNDETRAAYYGDTYREGRYQYLAARGFEGACRVITIKPL